MHAQRTFPIYIGITDGIVDYFRIPLGIIPKGKSAGDTVADKRVGMFLAGCCLDGGLIVRNGNGAQQGNDHCQSDRQTHQSGRMCFHHKLPSQYSLS